MPSVSIAEVASSMRAIGRTEREMTPHGPMRTVNLDPGLGPPPRVFFVDDEPKALDGFRRMLRPYSDSLNCYFQSDSRVAVAEIKRRHVDVVVTDLMMSNVSGIDLVERLKRSEETQCIPVIVVTGQQDRQLKRRALNAGATDLLTKPIEFEDLLARIRSAVRLKRCYDELNFKNAELESRVAKRTKQLQRSRLEMIARLGKAAEYRDTTSGRHVVRVAHYSRQIALEMHLSKAEAEMIFAAAPLHDVGKIAVPDSILLKTGVLTDEERRILQQHCAVGEKILSDSVDMLLGDRRMIEAPHEELALAWTDPVLVCAREIAASHHEHWNGGGYPRGLAGEDIPLAGRIVAIADFFDALTMGGPYKPPLSTAQAVKMIFEETGKQFDPRVYKAFVAAMPRIEVLRLQLQDD